MQKLKSTSNYYGATPDRPFHLSVGIIVLDANNDVLCLHYPKIDTLENIYTLPTETVITGETLEEAAKRGAQEELGCTVSVIAFLGTQAISDQWWGELGTPTRVEKSIVYFLCKAQRQETVALNDENRKRNVVSKTFEFLTETMQNISVKEGIGDFGQTQIEILKRAKKWIDTHQ